MTKLPNNRIQTPRARRRAYDPDPPLRPTSCSHPGCAAEGLYRAPKSRKQLNDYYWFCLDHVREYNRTWDYYAGMTPADIEKATRAALVGERPTWPLGSWGKGGNPRILREGPQSDLFPEDVQAAINAQFDKAKKRAEAARQRGMSAREQALAVLDLQANAGWDEIKKRYKALVKLLHPDANGGDKAAEERLKVINQAYSALKTAAV